MALQPADQDWADQMYGHLTEGNAMAHQALTTSPDPDVRDLASTILHSHVDHLNRLMSLGPGKGPSVQNSNSTGAGRKAEPEDATPENTAFSTGL